MSQIEVDPYRRRYAARTHGMTASEIRALFAVAARPEIVSLAGGSPATDLLDFDAVRSVVDAVLATNGPTALQYGGGQGLAGLRERLVEVMAVDGVAAHPDDLVVTTGGQQALDLLAKLFCDPGDIVIAEGPSYVGALGAFGAYQADVVHAPMDADGLIPEALVDRLDELDAAGRAPTFLYTVPNHQNPAGVSLSTPRREAIVEIAHQRDLLIVEDNPYGQFDFKSEVRPALRTMAPERVIYVGTLSKIFSPGIRCGWMAAAQPIRDKVVQLKEAADLCQSNLTQHVAEHWFATQPWQAQVATFRDTYRERCELLSAQLSDRLGDLVSFSPPTGGLFLWVRVPEGVDTGRMLAKALSARVAYVPGRGFYADGGGSRELRLCFSSNGPERIIEGIRRLAPVIRAEADLAAALFGGDR